ncbi:unnamed protein product [Protopolystoma xenopodis]|uniref:Uncharacterized protein n=1 Tax=Protopolystoma xenopodis TaxID=117903 RepID=A0A3S5CVI3_9PLAT|nr:unnamed protein product [Protopolystoma xenopodis]
MVDHLQVLLARSTKISLPDTVSIKQASSAASSPSLGHPAQAIATDRPSMSRQFQAQDLSSTACLPPHNLKPCAPPPASSESCPPGALILRPEEPRVAEEPIATLHRLLSRLARLEAEETAIQQRCKEHLVPRPVREQDASSHTHQTTLSTAIEEDDLTSPGTDEVCGNSTTSSTDVSEIVARGKGLDDDVSGRQVLTIAHMYG